jgi:hypothetical protein
MEIPMLPFSFKEYLSSFDNSHDLSLKYRDYLGGIYNTIILKVDTAGVDVVLVTLSYSRCNSHSKTLIC